MLYPRSALPLLPVQRSAARVPHASRRRPRRPDVPPPAPAQPTPPAGSGRAGGPADSQRLLRCSGPRLPARGAYLRGRPVPSCGPTAPRRAARACAHEWRARLPAGRGAHPARPVGLGLRRRPCFTAGPVGPQAKAIGGLSVLHVPGAWLAVGPGAQAPLGRLGRRGGPLHAHPPAPSSSPAGCAVSPIPTWMRGRGKPTPERARPMPSRKWPWRSGYWIEPRLASRRGLGWAAGVIWASHCARLPPSLCP